jgi:hypothetical protein
MEKVKNIIIALLAMLVIFVLLSKGCSNQTSNNGKVSIEKKKLEELIKKASEIKVVVKDTTIYKPKIVFKDRPVPGPIIILPDSINIYEDRFANSEIDVTVRDSVRGTILKRDWEYIPIIQKQTVEITKTVPELIYVSEPIQPSWKLQIEATTLASQSLKLQAGAGIGIINKNQVGLHYIYMSDFKNHFHGIKVSKTFNF